MRTREGFLTLMRELDGDVEQLMRAAALTERAAARIDAGARDAIDYGALGFTIHSAYGVLENYFLRISKFFENSLPSESWHRTLVERMSLDIPGLRPALILSSDTQSRVLEVMRFRHRFRNLYGEELDPDKTLAVERRLRELVEEVPEIHAEFRRKLAAIAEAL
ncbi:MAG: hypothetical protein EA426_15520 [Spirochaetaceae bacterium]|nr:MAG: hypothetical protein EA426_15520 [Spirochaetaceae bacterium]